MTSSRAISERLVVRIDLEWVPQTLRASSDLARVAYAAQEKGRWFVVADDQEQPTFDGIEGDSLTFSPDSRRLAYGAQLGDHSVDETIQQEARIQ